MSQTIPVERRRGSRGPAPSNEANLRDVARLAGVSPATVSRVFSGRGTVSERTRVKVMDAADKVGYVVNGLAKALMGTGHRQLALVIPAVANSAATELISGIEQVATDNGNLFILAMTQGSQEKESALIATLRERRVAGVILAGRAESGPEADAQIGEYRDALASVGARLVLCDHSRSPACVDVGAVGYDHIGGMQRLVGHLTEKGHTRIAFLGMGANTAAAQRFLGYSLGCKAAGLTLDSSLVVNCDNRTVDAQLASLLLLNKPEPPTAIICLSDAIALGVYRAAHDLDINVPRSLAIAGFDDSPHAADLTPSLTSVRVPFREIGMRCAELALGLVPIDTLCTFPTEVLLRESTA